MQGLFEDKFLNLREFLDPLKVELPSEVRVAPHHPTTRAWHVQHHPVDLPVQNLFKLGLIMMDLGILDSSTLKPLFGLNENTFPDVMQVDLPLIVHEGGKTKCLTSRASTVIQNQIPWLAVHSHGQKLTSLVLDLKVPVFEFLHGEKVPLGLLQEFDAVRSILCRLYLPAVVFESLNQLIPGSLDSIGPDGHHRPLILSPAYLLSCLGAMRFHDLLV
jgi:hypothetical protein